MMDKQEALRRTRQAIATLHPGAELVYMELYSDGCIHRIAYEGEKRFEGWEGEKHTPHPLFCDDEPIYIWEVDNA